MSDGLGFDGRLVRSAPETATLPPDPPDARSDTELIAAFNRGDPGAFDVLYRRYRDWIVNVAYRFSGHAEDAHDVLQETFAYLLRKCPRLELSGRLTTFLYPAVKHLALATRRKRGRFTSDEQALAALAEASRPDDPTGRELIDAVRTLSQTHREILLLRFVDDLSLHEIAGTLEVPLGTVKSRLNHAVAALRASPTARRYFDLEPPVE